jgi:hypothetical protein
MPVVKFDWNDDGVPKQIPENSHENKRLIKFMGNSVVPDQVRFAFESMLDMKLEGVSPTDKDLIVKCGYSIDGDMFKIKVSQTCIPKLNIVLTPREIPEKHNVPNEDAILTKPYLLPFWNTPAFCYHKSARGSRVLTKRQKNNLHSQIKFCPGSSSEGFLSGKFCAWLMGYDAKYLGHLMDY